MMAAQLAQKDSSLDVEHKVHLAEIPYERESLESECDETLALLSAMQDTKEKEEHYDFDDDYMSWKVEDEYKYNKPSRAKRFTRHFRPSQSKSAKRNILLALLTVVTTLLFAVGILLLVLLGAFDPAPKLRPQVASVVRNLTESWTNPADSTKLLEKYQANLTKGIKPIPLHSHNDYLRDVPLYDAIAVGATGVEADIFMRSSSSNPLSPKNTTTTDLQVAHSVYNLDATRTLQSLYLAPILSVLNASSTTPKSIYQDSPNSTLVLMIDFKESVPGIYELVLAQLAPLRNAGYLTSWSADKGRVDRQVTVVASGCATLPWIMQNTTYRDVFLDAPLLNVAEEQYSTNNSHYASVRIGKATGYLWAGQYSKKQKSKVAAQIKSAADKGLHARYWGTISWPRKWMLVTWNQLWGAKVGMLNANEIDMASRLMDW